jgi:hypothetical protein
MDKLDQRTARIIVESVGQNGTPPEYGVQFFTFGLDTYLSVLESEYMSSFIKQGGATFKMVVGVYGGGKTHFLYCTRDLAWKHNFVVSYVSLSPNSCPFHRLDMVYKSVVQGMTAPLSPDELLSGHERGIVPFLRSWYATKQQYYARKGLSGGELREALKGVIEDIRDIESITFANAVRSAFEALMNKNEEGFGDICQWLLGEAYVRAVHRKYGILQQIDKTTAFPMFRSLLQWIREIGYSGLVVLLDEAERVPSLSSGKRELHLNNLRELIDQCGHASFQGVAVFYAVPDENFLEGRTQIYEALRQRVATVFDTLNPTGVKIELEKVSIEPISFLAQVGERLRQIYEVAYDHRIDDTASRDTMHTVAAAVYEQRFGDIGYKRLFVQKAIQALHFLRQKGRAPSLDELNL